MMIKTTLKEILYSEVPFKYDGSRGLFCLFCTKAHFFESPTFSSLVTRMLNQSQVTKSEREQSDKTISTCTMYIQFNIRRYQALDY